MRGELYVITFDNGITKVGRTDDFSRRFHEHRRDAGRFGLQIANWWCSEQVESVGFYENRLISTMAQIGLPAGAGREYFRGVPFSVAVAAVQRMLAGHCRFCEYFCSGVLHVVGSMVAAPRIERLPGLIDLMACDVELSCGAVAAAVIDTMDLYPDGPTPLPLQQPMLLTLADSRSRRHPQLPWTIWHADHRLEPIQEASHG